MCPIFIPKFPRKNPYSFLSKKEFRYEKFTAEKYFYEDEEFLEQTVDERKLNLSYIEILNKIDTGGINIKDLGVKM